MAESSNSSMESMSNRSTNVHAGSCDTISSNSAVISGKLAAYSILMIVALLGNILTVLVIYTNTRLRSLVDYLIVNMAISNLLIPTVALPYQIITNATSSSAWLVDGLAGQLLCKVVFILVDVSPVVSIFSLIGITLQQFWTVVRGSQTNNSLKITQRLAMFLIFCTWFSALAIFSPYFYTFRLSHHDDVPYCVQRWSPAFDHVKAFQTFSTIVVVLVIILPFCFLTILYSVILISVTKYLPHYKPQSALARRRRHRAIHNTTVMAFALVLSFGLCWGPYNVVIMLWAFAWHWQPLPSCNWRLFFFCAQFFTYVYSCVFPSIYLLFVIKYKQGMKRLISRLLSKV